MTVRPPDALRRTLLRAIQIERRNSGLYESLAQVFEGYEDSVCEIFREMAEEERRHGADLKQRYRARFGPVPLLTDDPKEIIEGPDLDDAEALVFDSMSREKALRVGLRAEEAARDFYQREVFRTPDPELRQLYRELGEFEQDHVRRLQDKLVETKRSASATPR